MRDIAEMIRSDIGEREQKAQRNRERMPYTAAIVDQFTAAFGQVKILWAKEGDIELGKQTWMDAA